MGKLEGVLDDGWTRLEEGDLDRARKAADQALRLDSSSAEAHTLLGAVLAADGDSDQALGSFRNGGTYAASSELENRGVSLVARWDVNEVLAFKSITADRRLDWSGTRDADNTPLLILHTNYTSESKQFSQELQALLDSERLDGVVGLYYFDEDSFDRLLVPLGNPGTSYDTQRVSMDAEAHAADDQSRREAIEARNQADAIIYQVEKAFTENKAKLGAADVSRLESALDAAKQAVKGDDVSAIRSATTELQRAAHAMAETLYKSPAASPQADGDVKDGEVVDAA